MKLAKNRTAPDLVSAALLLTATALLSGCSDPSTDVMPARPQPPAFFLGGIQVNEADHEGWFENDEFVVTFAVGHLFELLPPEEVDPVYKRWTLDVLPIMPDERDRLRALGYGE